MRNPQYADDYQAAPMPERVVSINMGDANTARPMLSMGVKTITHNRDGLRLHPHKVVVIEMTEGDEIASFDLPSSMARMYASRLLEFANAVDKANRS